MHYETLHISKVRVVLLWTCAVYFYGILLILFEAIFHPLF